MALTNNQTAVPRQVLVANPHLHGTPYDRKVALIVEAGRTGFRGIVVDEAFRQSLIAARKSLPTKSQSRLEPPASIELGMIQWGPGTLEDEIRSGIWIPVATTFETMLASEDDLWATLIRGIGRTVLREALGIKNFPEDIRVN